MCQRMLEGKRSLAQAAQAAGVSEGTGTKWLARSPPKETVPVDRSSTPIAVLVPSEDSSRGEASEVRSPKPTSPTHGDCWSKRPSTSLDRYAQARRSCGAAGATATARARADRNRLPPPRTLQSFEQRGKRRPSVAVAHEVAGRWVLDDVAAPFRAAS
ncbi:MAG: leucine zipper domain-containing protein [Solirubrobacteraceae bacterium]